MSSRLLIQLQRAHSRRCDRYFGSHQLGAARRAFLALVRRKMAADLRRKDGRRIWSVKRPGCCCPIHGEYRSKLGFTRDRINEADGPMHRWKRRRPIVDFGRDRLDDMIPW